MIDPYKILGVGKDYTLEQLKEAYRRVALLNHPDKGGTEYMFNIITKCFKKLMREYNDRQNNMLHHEMKTQYKKPFEKPPLAHDFNIDKFNKVFDENYKKETVGYKDFLKQEGPPKTESKYLKLYKAPEPMAIQTKMAYTVLGEDKTDDYSSSHDAKNLKYMDLKIAHTTQKVLDEKTYKARQEYKNIDHLMVERSKINYEMSDQDKREYSKTMMLEQERESKRLANLRKMDQDDQKKYDQVMRLLLKS